MINLFSFESEADPKKLQKGRELFEKNCITSADLFIDGEYSFWFKPEKNYYYGTRVTAVFTDSGDLDEARCSCQRMGDDELCGHKCAAFLYIREHFEEDLEKRREAVFRRLMDQCLGNGEEEDTDESRESIAPPVTQIVPVVTMKDGALRCSLKAGGEKLYAVSSIPELKAAFEAERTAVYGKNAVFRHSYSELDERSRKILDLCYYYYSSSAIESGKSRVNGVSKKYVIIHGSKVDTFFRLFKDGELEIDKQIYQVKYKIPKIEGEIFRADEKGYSIRMLSWPDIYDSGKRTCLINYEKHTIYITDTGFTETALRLLRMCISMNKIYIRNENMPAFYSGVLRAVKKYIDIRGIDSLDDFVPPELEARLYIDSVNDGVQARPEFVYGDEKYTGFYSQTKNPFCDYKAERIIRNIFSKYFDEEDHSNPGTFIMHGDDRLYELLTVGLNEFEKYMDVFVTDAFKKIGVRAPARPAIGIRPSGSLLALDITAEGYTMSELVDMLKSYRKGAKYHRLKDGSFALITDSMSELASVADNLNISDKALLKEKLTVPAYRMLYLDSLKKNCENLRINRSAEFKKAVSTFGMMVDDSEQLTVPVSLDGIMREYQKYGFRWLRTISAYKFGGILADDMGLGKTLQAISLILSNRQNGCTKPALVVCPASLSLNWKNEISRFAPELKTLTVIGSVSAREELFRNINDYDVIITPYSLLTRDIEKYENTEFSSQFIDEAQYIKNQNTQAAKAVKAIKADVKFALTGTPVENSLAELWSIFDYIMPDYLYNYTYFRKNYEAPITAKKEEKVVSELQKVISPFILRRMKKEVLKELPDKTETVMYASMGEEQSRIYSANVADVKKTLAKELKDGADRIKILAMLTRLRQICCDPSLVYDNYSGESAKLEQCIELVNNCVISGHKILLFSQFTSMLDIISKRLDEEGVSYYTITGQTKPAERIRLVNEFNEDGTNVFLISLKAGGTGLNLTGADIVIHYDPWWNLSAENQASDRAYRIGQKRNVQIYKLITDKTIEEKIIELQTRKAELYDIAVNGEGDIMHMSADDILSILE
ncbi:MAG: SNF2 family helicase [Oscillospiraceae bacterium]|nr:SNF2 family helicase [Oscillospiraceae bacterium]